MHRSAGDLCLPKTSSRSTGHRINTSRSVGGPGCSPSNLTGLLCLVVRLKNSREFFLGTISAAYHPDLPTRSYVFKQIRFSDTTGVDCRQNQESGRNLDSTMSCRNFCPDAKRFEEPQPKILEQLRLSNTSHRESRKPAEVSSSRPGSD